MADASNTRICGCEKTHGKSFARRHGGRSDESKDYTTDDFYTDDEPAAPPVEVVAGRQSAL